MYKASIKAYCTAYFKHLVMNLASEAQLNRPKMYENQKCISPVVHSSPAVFVPSWHIQSCSLGIKPTF